MVSTTNSVNNVTYQLQGDNDTSSVYYDDDFPILEPSEICLVFIYIIIILLGFIGNSLVIFAICKRSRQNVTSLLLCSLAFSDLFMVLIFMPFKVMDLFRYGPWIYGGFMCRLISYIVLVMPSCSGCMLMVISLERYIVILYPLKARSFLTKTRAIFIVATAWVVSLALGVPAIVYQKHILQEEYSSPGSPWFNCQKLFPNDSHAKFYSVYGFTILYVVPLFVMGLSYTRVILALYSSSIASKSLQQSTSSDKQNNIPIYKPQQQTGQQQQQQKNEGTGGVSGDGQSSDNDPFATPETQAQQQAQRSNEGTVNTTASQGKAPAGRKRKKGQVTLNDRRQVIVMLMVVVLLYAICWGPLLLVSIFIRFNLLDQYSNEVFYASIFCHILAFANCTVNPIVYGFMSRNFRKTVITAFKNCCGSGSNLQRNTYNSTCNSRYYSTTCNSVTQTQTIYVKREPNPNSQTIEMTQYTKIPTNDVS
ncbi:QRFP-like peptide receptor [Amphiura filiformis]|uniref:QRFP-like peptide receptor n=1 Tax=Amphiura filiformis TaxID=82378 RepID=UPI003B20B8B6